MIDARVVGAALAVAGALAAAAHLVAIPAAGAADPAAVCASRKLKASGKATAGAMVCHAKAAKNQAAVDPACLDRFDEKLERGFIKAESPGHCTSADDLGAARNLVDQGVTDLTGMLPAGSGQAAGRCAFSKRKAAGKDAKSNLSCRAKAVKREEAVDENCLTKASAKLTKKFIKAEARGGCETLGDDSAVDAEADSIAGGLELLLAPACGDGVAGGEEVCDGDDDAACPGQCLPDCRCGGLCGNGLAELGEECDDGGTVPGDGCAADCTLENATALCAGVPTSSGTSLAKELVGTFSSPVHVAAPPLDPRRIFVVEQPGRIRIVRDGVVLPAPFLDISALVSFGGERGLLSMAFHPDYEANGRVFVNYTDSAGDTVVARYEVSANPDVADATSGVEVLEIDQPFSNHNGGQIAFGADGYLYVGMGDGGGGGDPLDAAEDDAQILGKMLRMDIDVDVPPYHAVPPSNPAPGLGTPFGLVWAKGLRNPWRFSFDRANGDMYIADVGQFTIEEISYEPGTSAGGLDFGWDIFEGSNCFEPDPGPACPPAAGFTFPVHEYTHASGCSITGGHVYRGCALPDLAGTYFFSDFCTPFVRTFEISGGVATNLVDRTPELGAGLSSISSYGEDARGELYIASLNGNVWRIVAP